MKSIVQQDMAMPELVGKLTALRSSLSAEEQSVFAEMISLAASQAEELQGQRATELTGGAGAQVFAKPISAVTSVQDLTAIRQLGGR
jgi:hypothetical protein